MKSEISDELVALDSPELLVVMDNETDTLSSIDEGILQIPEEAQLSARTKPDRIYQEHECKTVFDQLYVHCRGRSSYPKTFNSM